MVSDVRSPTINTMYHAARIFLGLVFLYASIDKIMHPADFARIVRNYQILPDSLINITAVVLPWIEVFLGICLICNVWMPGAVLTGNIFMVVYTLAKSFNLARGLDISCGCFSTSMKGRSIGYMDIAMDMFFLLVGLFLLFYVLIRGEEQDGSGSSVRH